MSHIAEACCVNPPVLGEEYKPVGKDVTVDGLKTYAVGPSDAGKAVLLLYDAMGLTHQTYTAADMLASLMPGTVVLMPDFFKGEPMKLEMFSLPEEQKKEIIGEWFGRVADLQRNRGVAEGIVANTKSAGFPNVAKFGAFGLCWGGKMTAGMSAEGTPFSVAGTAHPGRPDAAEADAMVIPYICLLSPDDASLEDRQAYEKALDANKNDNFVETYEDRVHGWMGARCDFKDDRAKAEFERGYKKVAEFMNKHLA